MPKITFYGKLNNKTDEKISIFKVSHQNRRTALSQEEEAELTNCITTSAEKKWKKNKLSSKHAEMMCTAQKKATENSFVV